MEKGPSPLGRALRDVHIVLGDSWTWNERQYIPRARVGVPLIRRTCRAAGPLAQSVVNYNRYYLRGPAAKRYPAAALSLRLAKLLQPVSSIFFSTPTKYCASPTLVTELYDSIRIWSISVRSEVNSRKMKDTFISKCRKRDGLTQEIILSEMILVELHSSVM